MGNLDGAGRIYAVRKGSWTAESGQVQSSLTFENLFDWLETQHSRGEQFNVKEAGTVACGVFLVYSTYYLALWLTHINTPSSDAAP